MKKLYAAFFLAFSLFMARSSAQTNTCTAQFTVSQSGNAIQCVPLLNGTTAIVHIWNFGDGASSTAPQPSHTYNNCGTYQVKHVVTVYNPNGVVICADSTVMAVTIQCSTPCNLQADFVFAPLPTQPNVFAFSNTSVGLAPGDSVRWNFGDGSAPSYDLNTQHTFPAAGGTFNVCLRIKRITAPGTPPCVSETCRTITIANPQPCNLQPSYSISIPNTTQPNILVFTNTTPGSTPNTQVTWTFGDGSAGTGNTVTHTYTQTGPFTVCMHVTQSSACAADTCGPVTVTLPSSCNMQANFSFQPVQGTANTFSFTNTSIGFAAGDSIRWTFGDGSAASYDLNPTHTFPGPGTYNVCIRIKKNGQPAGTAPCVREFCRVITITAPCSLSPSYSITTNPAQPNLVVFTNTTPGSTANTLVTWNFGDGSTGTGNTVTHLFTQTGPFNVCMHITVSNTCSADTCGPVTVTIPQACNMQANFSFQPVQGTINTFTFTNTSTGFAAGDSIRWTFGDGSAPSYDLNPTHTFPGPGTYNVCLRIKKNGQPAGTAPCVREICRTITIAAPCNISASFTYQVNPNQPNVIVFTNTSVNTSAPAVAWNFGDSTTGTGNIVTHTFSQPGTYHVCMIVSYSNTCIRDTCMNITIGGVTPPPACNLQAGFSWQIQPTSAIPVVYFLNTSTGFAPGDSIRWTFGDGTSSYDVNPVHTYASPGTYQVCLRVKKNPTQPGTAPCVSEICRTVTIGNTPPPVICDSVRVRYTFIRDAFMPNKIYFITISNFPVMQESWTIMPLSNTGSTVTLNQYNPAWVFNQPGSYRVCLRAVTQGNCIKEYCDTVNITNVVQQCQLLAYPNPATSQVSVNAVMSAPGTIYAFLFNSQNVLLQRLVRSGQAGSNPVTFNISTLPAGYYSIRLYYNGRVCVSRFQKL